MWSSHGKHGHIGDISQLDGFSTEEHLGHHMLAAPQATTSHFTMGISLQPCLEPEQTWRSWGCASFGLACLWQDVVSKSAMTGASCTCLAALFSNFFQSLRWDKLSERFLLWAPERKRFAGTIVAAISSCGVGERREDAGHLFQAAASDSTLGGRTIGFNYSPEKFRSKFVVLTWENGISWMQSGLTRTRDDVTKANIVTSWMIAIMFLHLPDLQGISLPATFLSFLNDSNGTHGVLHLPYFQMPAAAFTHCAPGTTEVHEAGAQTSGCRRPQFNLEASDCFCGCKTPPFG